LKEETDGANLMWRDRLFQGLGSQTSRGSEVDQSGTEGPIC